MIASNCCEVVFLIVGLSLLVLLMVNVIAAEISMVKAWMQGGNGFYPLAGGGLIVGVAWFVCRVVKW